jgi:hypothetical protein
VIEGVKGRGEGIKGERGEGSVPPIAVGDFWFSEKGKRDSRAVTRFVVVTPFVRA